MATCMTIDKLLISQLSSLLIAHWKWHWFVRMTQWENTCRVVSEGGHNKVPQSVGLKKQNFSAG